MKKKVDESIVPRQYNKDKAILDLKWAESLHWFWTGTPDRAWQVLTKVVRYVVDEGPDPGNIVQPQEDEGVSVSVIYPPIKNRYINNVFKQNQTPQEGQEGTDGCC
jgi:hypothetical protein